MPEHLEFLTVEDLLIIAAEATGTPAAVRDYGLLDSAANRPRASAFGQDAYPSIHHKAAAMLQSLVMNHGLVDGNKRLAWLATFVFYDLNRHDLAVVPDDGFDLMMAVIKEHLEVDEIAERFAAWCGDPAHRRQRG